MFSCAFFPQAAVGQLGPVGKGKRAHFCSSCNFPAAKKARCSPCLHVFCLSCAANMDRCMMWVFENDQVATRTMTSSSGACFKHWVTVLIIYLTHFADVLPKYSRFSLSQLALHFSSPPPPFKDLIMKQILQSTCSKLYIWQRNESYMLARLR